MRVGFRSFFSHLWLTIRQRTVGILSVWDPCPGSSSHMAEPGLQPGWGKGFREVLQNEAASCHGWYLFNKLSSTSCLSLMKCPVLPTFITLFSVSAYISWTHTSSSVDYLHLFLQVLVAYLSSVWVVASPIDALRMHGTQHCFHSPPPPFKNRM